jgi:hypothetical protein
VGGLPSAPCHLSPDWVRQPKIIVNKKDSKGTGADSSLEKTITELFQAIQGLEFDKQQPGEGILADARELAAQWKIKKRPLFEGLLDNKRLVLLVALVVALREDHRLVARIRTFFPGELEKLSHDSAYEEIAAVASAVGENAATAYVMAEV